MAACRRAGVRSACAGARADGAHSRGAASAPSPGNRPMIPSAAIGRTIRGAATGIAFALILLPIVIVVITAFSPGDYFEFPPPGLSTRWFIEFFRLAEMRNAFALSLELALVAATLATALGTMGALFLARRRGGLATLLQSLFLAPLVFPTIILGVALLLLYRTVGMP